MEERPPIDISPANWRIIRDILQRYVPEREVWAFGSRAKWTAKEFSDLDLVVIGDEAMDFGVLADLNEAFQESTLPIKVDVVDWATISESFRNVIQSHKVSVKYGQGTLATRRRTAALGDLLELIIDHRGKTPKKLGGDFSDFGIPVLSAKHVKDGALTDIDQLRHVSGEMYKKWMPVPLRKSDVLLTSEAPLGELYFLDSDTEYVLGQRLFALRAKSEIIYPRYLYYFLKSATGQSKLHERATGTTAQGIRQSELLKVLVDFPVSTDEQAFVADLLGALDDRIALLRETNDTLEAIAQALFKSWFVDFDPVRAKAEGREPEGVPPEIVELFPSEFEISAHGEIPKGWQVKRVDEVCEKIFSGGTPDTRKPEYWSGVNPWFSSGETRNSIIVGTEKRISDEAVRDSSTKLAKCGDILIASAGQGTTRGQTSLAAIDTYINQSVVALRADNKHCDSTWLFYNLIGRYDEMRMLSDSHSIRGSLTTKLLGSMKVCLPRKEVVDSFSEIVRPTLESRATNIMTTEALSGLRDSLLPRLMSGQIQASLEST